MTQTKNPDPLPLGGIRFFDNCVPALEVGDYLINVAQQINPVTSPAIDEWHVASQLFSVQGLRYALPPEDIFSLCPPENSQGIFDQSLPQVVLTKRELPWERNIFDDPEETQTPWMALLLFVEGETINGQPTLLPPQVENWVKNSAYSATLPAAQFQANSATASPIRWPRLSSEWYESQDFLNNTPCSFIDISPTAFNTLVPCKADLRYLAHVRQVDPTAKDSDVLKITGDGWYSVLLGNRLPDPPPPGSNMPGKRNIVHLVSLEGFADCFNSAGVPTAPAGAMSLRLISLASWSFLCVPEMGESFSEVMNALLVNPAAPANPTAFILPVPALPPNPAAEDTYAWNAIQSGYAPVNYQTRLGEETFAWYRGPFSPVPVANFISTTPQASGNPSAWTPFDTASSAIIYDKQYGVFDISYAVAWEAGRMLALADGLFGQQLMDWQRKGHGLIDMVLERKGQMSMLKSFDPENPDPAIEDDLLGGIQKYAVTGDFMKYLINEFTTQIAPAIAVPVASSPAPPYPAFAAAPTVIPNSQTISDLLTQSDIQNAIRDIGGQELDSIADWLAQRYVLMNVPFENLLPHANLLPPESLRFFYLDSNWLDALVEGALSIGIESSRDRLYQDLMKDLIWNSTFAAVQSVRDNLLGARASIKPAGSNTPFDQQSLSGMLLHSSVVSGFPGMEINAYANTLPGSSLPDLNTGIPLLRAERLSSDVLLCLWPAVPAVVCIEEPHEGVTFGFEDPPDSVGEGDYLYLRSLDPAKYGIPMCTDAQTESGKCTYQLDGASVIDSNRLLNISGTNGLLQQISKLLPGSLKLGIHDFALQMIKVPEQAVIAVPLSVKLAAANSPKGAK